MLTGRCTTPSGTVFEIVCQVDDCYLVTVTSRAGSTRNTLEEPRGGTWNLCGPTPSDVSFFEIDAFENSCDVAGARS